MRASRASCIRRPAKPRTLGHSPSTSTSADASSLHGWPDWAEQPGHGCPALMSSHTFSKTGFFVRPSPRPDEQLRHRKWNRCQSRSEPAGPTALPENRKQPLANRQTESTIITGSHEKSGLEAIPFT
jgi:hypothetical protein